MPDRILLIRPPNIYNYNNYPPLNLICLGTVLKEAGFDVRIVNAALEADPLSTIDRELDGALLVGITLITSEAPGAHEILSHIRKRARVPVVVGGWHCSLFPEQMAASDLVDYVVSGEGEHHVRVLAEALRDGKDPGREIFPKEILDIEQLPAPDYDLDAGIEGFVSSYLTDKLSARVPQPMRWLPYESSRGCPSQCTFCINTVTDNLRYRKKSAEKVLSEVAEIVGRYRLTHVKFTDDNFFVDIQRVRGICRGLTERGLDVTWDAECRCDYFNERMLNDETLTLAKRSGLVQVTLGIESGSPHTLELMKKGITPEQAEHAVAQCDRHGILARSSFMLEIPGDTLPDIRQTVSFINRLRRYKHFTCGVTTFRPYPRCELTRKLLADGHLKEPADFAGWTDRSVVEMYTSAEYVRPWQVNGAYSEKAAMYLNMESAVRLGNHQIDRWIDRAINTLFILLAGIRNRLRFYRFAVDKSAYSRFLTRFYRRRSRLEKAGRGDARPVAVEGAGA